MKTWAIAAVIVLLVVVAGLRFMVFGPIGTEWKQAEQALVDNRGEFVKISQYGTPSEITHFVRRTQEANRQYYDKLETLMEAYTVEKPEVNLSDIPQDIPPQRKDSMIGERLTQEILNRVREIEQIETSAASLVPQVREEGQTVVTVLRNWGIAELLRQEQGGVNRFLYATGDDVDRTYAGGNERINTRAGTIDMYVRPRWRTALGEDNRYLFYARGSHGKPPAPAANAPAPAPGTQTPEKFSTIEIYRTADQKIVFSLTNPDNEMGTVSRAVDVSQWRDNEWHRVTATWDENTKTMQVYLDGRLGVPATLGATRRSPAYFGNPYSPGNLNPGGDFFPNPTMGRGRPRTTAEPMINQIVVPYVIDQMWAGSMAENQFSAEADIDNLRILNYAMLADQLQEPLQRTRETLLLDDFQTPYGDSYWKSLVAVLEEMESCIKLIREPGATADLQARKTDQLRRLRASLGWDMNELVLKSSKTRYMIELLMCDQISRLIAQGEPATETERRLIQKYTRPYIMNTILDVKDLTQDEKESTIGFLDLILNLLRSARENNLNVVTNITILGEARVVSDAEYMVRFRQEFEALKKELNIKDTPAGGAPGALGMPGPMPFGMGPMPFGPYGAFGMTPAGMTSEAFEGKMEKYKTYKEYIESKKLPPDVRERYTAEEPKDSPYVRRILQIDVIGDINFIPAFVYDLEFGKYLTTIASMSLKSLERTMISCSVAAEFHYFDLEVPGPAASVARTDEPGATVATMQ